MQGCLTTLSKITNRYAKLKLKYWKKWERKRERVSENLILRRTSRQNMMIPSPYPMISRTCCWLKPQIFRYLRARAGVWCKPSQHETALPIAHVHLNTARLRAQRACKRGFTELRPEVRLSLLRRLTKAQFFLLTLAECWWPSVMLEPMTAGDMAVGRVSQRS